MRKFILTTALVGAPSLDLRAICHAICPKGLLEWQNDEFQVVVHFACFDKISEVPTYCSVVMLVYDAGDLGSFEYIQDVEIDTFPLRFVLGYRSSKQRQVRFKAASALGDRVEGLWTEVGGSDQFSVQFVTDMQSQVLEYLRTGPVAARLLRQSESYYTELPDIQFRLAEVVDRLPGKVTRLKQAELARENPFADFQDNQHVQDYATTVEPVTKEAEYKFGDEFLILDKSETEPSFQELEERHSDLSPEDLQIQQVSSIEKSNVQHPVPITIARTPVFNSLLDIGLVSGAGPSPTQLQHPKSQVIPFNEDSGSEEDEPQFVRLISGSAVQTIAVPAQRIKVEAGPLSPEQRLLRKYAQEEREMRISHAGPQDKPIQELELKLQGRQYSCTVRRDEPPQAAARRALREHRLPESLTLEASSQINQQLNQQKRRFQKPAREVRQEVEIPSVRERKIVEPQYRGETASELRQRVQRKYGVDLGVI